MKIGSIQDFLSPFRKQYEADMATKREFIEKHMGPLVNNEYFYNASLDAFMKMRTFGAKIV